MRPRGCAQDSGGFGMRGENKVRFYCELNEKGKQ